MLHRHRRGALRRPLALLPCLLLGIGGLAACSGAETQASASATTAASDDLASTEEPEDPAPAEFTDSELADWQERLLALSFSAASDFPQVPHHKNRGRAQEVVVQACLDLGAPELALEYARGITNWRKAAGYADTAIHRIDRGETGARVRDLLDEARRMASSAEGWRRDRVLAKVAKGYALLGEGQLVLQIVQNVSRVEASRVTEAFARRTDAEGCRQQLEGLTEVAKTSGLEEIREGLEACVELHRRFYGDEDLRGEIEATIRGNAKLVPLEIRIRTLCSLAENHLAQDATETAIAALDEAREMRESAHWTAEYGVPLRALEAGLRHRAGQVEAAREGFAAAFAQYDQSAKAQILKDFYRADALVPLAEAYADAGMQEDALRIYRLALEEGSNNPNARPRTDDLGLTCCSMAVHGIRPDEELWDRITTIRESIRDAW